MSIPDMAFCPNCGVAARAASRRRELRGGRASGEDVATPRPGYAVPAGSYEVRPCAIPLIAGCSRQWRRRGHNSCGGGDGGSTGDAAVVRGIRARRIAGVRRSPSRSTSNPRFVSADGEFSVQYPGPGIGVRGQAEPGLESSSSMSLATPAHADLWGCLPPIAQRSRSSTNMIAENYPDATARLRDPQCDGRIRAGIRRRRRRVPAGLQRRVHPAPDRGADAVKNDYALVAAAIGPYHEFSPDFGTGHPSGVNLATRHGYG